MAQTYVTQAGVDLTLKIPYPVEPPLGADWLHALTAPPGTTASGRRCR